MLGELETERAQPRYMQGSCSVKAELTSGPSELLFDLPYMVSCKVINVVEWNEFNCRLNELRKEVYNDIDFWRKGWCNGGHVSTKYLPRTNLLNSS